MKQVMDQQELLSLLGQEKDLSTSGLIMDGLRFAILSFLSTPKKLQKLHYLHHLFFTYMKRHKVRLSMIEWGRILLTNYMKNDIDGWEIPSTVAAPLPLTFPNSNITVFSVPDRMVTYDGETWIFKYTLSSIQEAQGTVEEDIQLALNALAFSHKNEQSLPLKLCLYYLDQEKIDIFTPTDSDLQTTYLFFEDRLFEAKIREERKTPILTANRCSPLFHDPLSV